MTAAVTASAPDSRVRSGEPASVVILGSTGSIGTQALAIVDEHPDRFRVTGLACGGNLDLLVEQVRAHGVRRVALADRRVAAEARAVLGDEVEVLDGPSGVTALAGCGADIVLNGLVSSRGLRPTLAALEAGSRLALANKESLVLGGPLVLAASKPGQIVPVDSEHSALAQCLRAGGGAEVARLVLTASGGPFRGRSRAELADVTVREALAHPTWSMGSVITINSATLANKGLEVVEAHLLFGFGYDRIEVVVHPESIVHGMVEFRDGATIAKLSPPDMRLPIQYALGWPERLDFAAVRMDWTRPLELHFEPVDSEAFPMLGLAVEAGRRGGAWPGVYNAANEEAVAAFSTGRLGFLGIPAVVEATLEAYEDCPTPDLDTLLAVEEWARRHARECVAGKD